MMTSCFEIQPGVFLSRVDGEGMLYNANNEICYRLNSVATEMWQRIAEGKSGEEIVEELAEKYGVEKERVSSDFQNLVNDLEKKGLLCESSAS